MLSPRIKADEPFEMTLEQDGHSYTFKGYLSDTEIEFHQELIDVSEGTEWQDFIPGIKSYTISLEIKASSMVRRVL